LTLRARKELILSYVLPLLKNITLKDNELNGATMETSKILKDYAKKYFSIFNVKPEVQRYYNENESKHIDVLSVQSL